jgi:hypothetical protein
MSGSLVRRTFLLVCAPATTNSAHSQKSLRAWAGTGVVSTNDISAYVSGAQVVAVRSGRIG